MQVGLNPVWLCCVVTSDRHAEGETPNKPTENHHKETLQSSPKFKNASQPRRSLLFSKGSDFHERAAVFSIVRFCCG